MSISTLSIRCLRLLSAWLTNTIGQLNSIELPFTLTNTQTEIDLHNISIQYGFAIWTKKKKKKSMPRENGVGVCYQMDQN